MLDELESSYPETMKVPGREGGYVRVPVSVNAEWYRRFCRRYMTCYRRRPKPRTFIKRCHTIKALGRMLNGDMSTVYAKRLISFREEWFDG